MLSVSGGPRHTSMWQLAFFQIEGDSLFTHFQLVGCSECKAGFRALGLLGVKLGQVHVSRRLLLHTDVHICHSFPRQVSRRQLRARRAPPLVFPRWMGAGRYSLPCLSVKEILHDLALGYIHREKKKSLFHGDLDSYRKQARCLVINKALGKAHCRCHYVNAMAVHASSCYMCASV